MHRIQESNGGFLELGEGEMWNNGHKVSVYESSRALWYNVVPVVNNTALGTTKFL